MTRLWSIRETFVEIVAAYDEDDAWRVFTRHRGEFTSQESDVTELKTVKDVIEAGYDRGYVPWGTVNDDSVADILGRAEAELWAQRRPVFITKPDDAGQSLGDLVPGFKKDITVGADIVGHVVYRLPDGTFRLETPGQREERLASGVSDGEVAKDIELSELRELLAQAQRRLEALDE